MYQNILPQFAVIIYSTTFINDKVSYDNSLFILFKNTLEYVIIIIYNVICSVHRCTVKEKGIFLIYPYRILRVSWILKLENML